MSIGARPGYDRWMATVLHPWQILVAAMAGWITRQQEAAVEYLREEEEITELVRRSLSQGAESSWNR